MPDVVIIGDGLIGLSTAFQLAGLGVHVEIIGSHYAGNASEAAAGLLSPSVGELPDAVRPFFYASLDVYSDFVERLREFDTQLRIIDGLIELPGRDDAARAFSEHSRALTSAELRELEPAIGSRAAILHSRDGAIDNVRLVAALRRAVSSSSRVNFLQGDVATAVEFDGQPTVVTRSGERRSANAVVLAAGAWSPNIAGLPRQVPVFPLKGQMLAIRSTAIRHAIMGEDAYLVPRTDEVVVGATVERAGFDLGINVDAIERLRTAAIRVCGALDAAPVSRTWAGIRPATPDMLPIIGRDPDVTGLIYACGHSKNGILLTPITAAVVCSLVLNEPPLVDIVPFKIERF